MSTRPEISASVSTLTFSPLRVICRSGADLLSSECAPMPGPVLTSADVVAVVAAMRAQLARFAGAPVRAVLARLVPDESTPGAVSIVVTVPRASNPLDLSATCDGVRLSRADFDVLRQSFFRHRGEGWRQHVAPTSPPATSGLVS